jgi:hypothetical protein
MTTFKQFFTEAEMIGQPASTALASGLGSRMADSMKKKQQLQFISQALRTQVAPGQVFPMDFFVKQLGVDNVKALMQAGVVQRGQGEFKIL